MKIFFVLSLLFFSASWSFAGGVIIEDGGAVVGNAATLQPVVAGLKPLTLAEIPGMALLTQKYEHLAIDPIMIRLGLKTIVPLDDHLYYQVNADFVTGLGRDFIAKYAAIVQMAPQDIKLFHFREIGGSLHTFLLPDFFKLSEIEAASLLLTQTADSPAKNEAEFRQLDLTTQAYFANPNDAEDYFKFYQQLFAPNYFQSFVLACWNYDVAHPAGLFSDSANTKMRFVDAFGEKFVSCWLNHPQDTTFANCKSLIVTKPSSLLARSLTEDILKNNPNPDSWAHLPPLSNADKLRFAEELYFSLQQPVFNYVEFISYERDNILGFIEFPPQRVP